MSKSQQTANPWDCGEGRGAWCDAESREHMVKGCTDFKRLAECLKWPDTQKSVKTKIERRLKQLAAEQTEIVTRECVKAEAVLPPEKAITIFECLAPDAVLPPEGAAPAKTGAVTLSGPGARVTLDGNADTQSVRRILNDGWRRAQGGLAEIIRFGATLLAVREWLDGNAFSAGERVDKKPGHGWNKDSGLKGWLAENCPDINYKTAYGYMAAASGLRREARLAEDVPLLAMMGEDPVPEARAEKLRQRVQRILAESTLGLLREAASAQHETAPKGGQRDGAGRKKQEPQAERDACAAWAVIGGKIDLAVGWRFARFLPAAVAREALSTVTTLQVALKARLDELGQEA